MVFIRILIVTLSFTLLPYVLIAGLLRVFLPQVKVWWLSLLSALVTLFADLHLHFFMSPVRIDRIIGETLNRVGMNEFGAVTYGWYMLVLDLTVSCAGAILIPLLLAYAGIAIVDKIRKSKRINPTPDGIRQPANGAPTPSA